jgi:RHS repeat-associated protein
MDGVGGVGGLAWVTLHTASGSSSGTHFTCYDGNGNIVALVSATTSDVTARYEYGPFGEPIRVSGPAATLNPFRFSTKRTCNTTELVLYEYRAYSSTLGRWPSRDPIGELGFTLLGSGTLPITGMECDEKSNTVPISERGDENLYVYVGNDSISLLDILGLVDFRFEPVVGELSGIISEQATGGSHSITLTGQLPPVRNRPILSSKSGQGQPAREVATRFSSREYMATTQAQSRFMLKTTALENIKSTLT